MELLLVSDILAHIRWLYSERIVTVSICPKFIRILRMVGFDGVLVFRVFNNLLLKSRRFNGLD